MAEWLVKTSKGDIKAEIVVNAAGYRAGEVMAMLGQHMPIVSMSHQYLITEPIPELVVRDDKLPLLRDPDISYYLREERDGLILGPYEWKATPMWTDGLPDDFANQLWGDDLDRIEWYIEQAIERVPILGTVGVQRVINGPIPYSPEGLPYIGPAHGLKNFFQCCCFSFGIAQSGGAGKTLAEWITEGEPEWDLWALDPRRYTGYATKTYVTAKAIELYQNEYAIGFPFEERAAGRPARTSPLYDRLKAKGARFGARGGWERAVFFDPDGKIDEQTLSFRRDRNWLETVGEECRAVREGVGILDLPGFSKYLVEGPGAEAWLDRLTCSKLPRLGRISLAYMLNDKGGVVSEYTITRAGKDRFHLISAAAAEWHDEDWLRSRLPDDGSVTLSCHHGHMGTIVLAGPKSRGRARSGDRHRPLQRGLPLAFRQADPYQHGRGDRFARQLCRRAWLGAARRGRGHDPALRSAMAGRRGPRHPRLRHVRHGEPSPRQVLSRLEVRSRQRIQPTDVQPGSLHRSRKARLHRQGTPCSPKKSEA